MQVSLVRNNDSHQKAVHGLNELVGRCKSGNPDAWERLYCECKGLVFRLAYRMVGANHAVDAVQMVFLRVFLTLHQFSGDAKFTTWLYRLSVNEFLQFLRRERHNSHERPLEREEVNPTDENAAVEAKELLEIALSRIDHESRIVFLLRETEELSYAEIASVLEIHEGTVGSRLNRARSLLRRHLTELGWEP